MVVFNRFQEPKVFRLVAVVCVLFTGLTAIAMLLYPGGTFNDQTSQGYSFFNNFFSDLGMTETRNNASNTTSMVLFTSALTAVGFGLAIFFIAFAQLFISEGSSKWLSALGAIFGVVAGICFIGVAFTPWNLYLEAHNLFVRWAFRLFLAAVILFIIAAWREKNLPRRFAWVFIVFAVVLTGYVLLLTFGPSVQTREGQMIQAAGQKIIVYASIMSVLIQALAAYRLKRT